MRTWLLQGRWLAVWLALPLTGCALGSVRQVTVDALGAYDDARGVSVEVKGEVPEDMKAELQRSFQGGVEARAPGRPEASGAPLRVELNVVEARPPDAPPASDAERLGRKARTVFGLSEVGKTGGRLALEGLLLAPEGGEPLGRVRWEAAGDPAALATRGGREAGEALGREMHVRREDFVTRRAADERMFLTPTALTLEPGDWALSNDELLLFRLAVGLGRRVQLDFWGGGFALPAAGSVPIAWGGVAGGAGIGVLGALDVGLKVKLLEEGRVVPGLSLSYDFLNLFAGGVGGAGAVLFGHGIVAVGAGGVAGANLQFNLFSLVAGKHFGKLHLTAGTYVLDNHHLVPQGASVVLASNLSDGTQTQGVVVPRLPTQVQPFLGAQYVLGPHSELAAEFFPRLPFEQSVLTTGVRWLLGSSTPPRGPLAYDRLRVRLAVAALWVFVPGTETGGGFPFPLPWVGLGLYKL